MDVLIERIRKAVPLLRAAGAKEIYILGSVLTEEMRDDSDVDIAVSGLRQDLFFRVMAEVSDIVGRPVDLLDLDAAAGISDYVRRSGTLKRVG
ncbi:MAG: nucleotidyltransferase domain-containing protein [Planctomycetaceae bacterium]|nr:nucleotidyltransferase domain-containing protein [Planctomycetaceae bacterium]